LQKEWIPFNLLDYRNVHPPQVLEVLEEALLNFILGKSDKFIRDFWGGVFGMTHLHGRYDQGLFSFPTCYCGRLLIRLCRTFRVSILVGPPLRGSQQCYNVTDYSYVDKGNGAIGPTIHAPRDCHFGNAAGSCRGSSITLPVHKWQNSQV
jgi:hypothetical protein